MIQGLKEMCNPRDPLYQLADRIPWDQVESWFEDKYAIDGRPAKPVRLMVSLLILKRLYNLGDETVVEEWVHNPYMQYFSGETEFQWDLPCEPSDLVHFRNRIGEEGVKKILKLSIDLHGKDAQEAQVVIDTTVQEKNITFPTDVKLHRKIATACVQIAKAEEIPLRQSYTRTVKHLVYLQRGRNNIKTKKTALKAARRLKTISGRLLRELQKKLPPESLKTYEQRLAIFEKVLSQERDSRNKIYSIHEPHVYCVAKGKDHKKYEFGSKVSIARTKRSGIIVGALNIETNQYDGHTLPAALRQIEELRGSRPTVAITDQGYRGKKHYGETEVVNARDLRRQKTAYGKRKVKKQLKQRSAIEPVIEHLKSGHRLSRNYLSGVFGDNINVMLAAAGYNFKRLLRKLKLFLLDFLRRAFAGNAGRTALEMNF
jgi:IS5 family transposase